MEFSDHAKNTQINKGSIHKRNGKLGLLAEVKGGDGVRVDFEGLKILPNLITGPKFVAGVGLSV